jgi:hypothetical protein
LTVFVSNSFMRTGSSFSVTRETVGTLSGRNKQFWEEFITFPSLQKASAYRVIKKICNCFNCICYVLRRLWWVCDVKYARLGSLAFNQNMFNVPSASSTIWRRRLKFSVTAASVSSDIQSTAVVISPFNFSAVCGSGSNHIDIRLVWRKRPSNHKSFRISIRDYAFIKISFRKSWTTFAICGLVPSF